MNCDKCGKECNTLYRIGYDPKTGYDGLIDNNGKYKKEKYLCESCSRIKIEEIRDRGYNIDNFEQFFSENKKQGGLNKWEKVKSQNILNKEMKI